MTKSLTEKWKDRELPVGTYYVVNAWDNEICMFYFEGDYFLDTDVPLDDDNIKEVLAPVPSYEELVRLMKKVELLEFDNDVLNSVSEQQDDKIISMDKEMANMRKQIMQANKCIKHCSTHPCCEKYLRKWGVK